jgi:hypothetical protein
LDPAQLSTYTIQWSTNFNTNELMHAKPLVWTPPGGGNEQVIVVSNQNIIRVFDGVTGTQLQKRTLDPPFTATDAQCGDIPNTIGITGTPVIDKNTNIMYFYSKGYKNGQAGPQGTINGLFHLVIRREAEVTVANNRGTGVYKLYAVQLPSLSNVQGWPVVVGEGLSANNDRARYFLGSTVLQRPGLVQVGNSIIAGFGGHCDNFNYTGMLVAVSKTTGSVTNMQAMMAAPGQLNFHLNIWK